MLKSALHLTVIGTFVVLLTPLGARAVGKSETFNTFHSKTVGRILQTWGQIEANSADTAKLLDLMEKINRYQKEIIAAKQKADIDFRPKDSFGVHRKIKRTSKEVFDLVETDPPLTDDLVHAFFQTQAWKKVPDKVLDDPRFINSFTQYVTSLWYEAGKATLNINDFAGEFSKRINKITRNNFSLFKCSEKPSMREGGVSLPSTYTCARGILADCTKPTEPKARILFVGTVSESNDDIDFSDLQKLYGVTDTHSCEKALRVLSKP